MKATGETLKTGFYRYYRPADRGETGETLEGQKERNFQITFPSGTTLSRLLPTTSDSFFPLPSPLRKDLRQEVP